MNASARATRAQPYKLICVDSDRVSRPAARQGARQAWDLRAGGAGHGTGWRAAGQTRQTPRTQPRIQRKIYISK